MTEKFFTNRIIELWPYDISSFERLKRCAYEFIEITSNKNPDGHFVEVQLDHDIFYRKGVAIDVSDIVQRAFDQGMEAIVQARECKSTTRDEYEGLAVRKAKGKWLRNFLLKHYY